jgi:hypothetical protein
MCLLARIRAVITAVVLASHSPVGAAIDHAHPAHPGHLAVGLFVGRRTRVAASQAFNVSNGYFFEYFSMSGSSTSEQSPSSLLRQASMFVTGAPCSSKACITARRASS